MTDQHSIDFRGNRPPETILPPEESEAIKSLELLSDLPLDEKRKAVSEMLAKWPHNLDGWATLGDLGRDSIESYAAYRVGYHRGLDRLRQNGWRGSGFVRWNVPTNRGFLRSLNGLAEKAREIGELDEAERCEMFLRQLDPASDISTDRE